MANLRILAKNVADDATVSGLGNTAYLQDQRRGMIATGAAAGDDLLLTWSANQAVNAVALVRHNFTDAATWRIYLYSDAAWTTNIYDSTALDAINGSILPAPFSLTEAQFAGMKTSVLYFTEQTTVRSAKITLTDAANPDSELRASRLIMGKYFETTYNPPHGGASLTPGTMTTQDRGDGGSLLSDLRAAYRTLALNLGFLPDADYDDIAAIVQYLGKHRDCFVDLYPGEDTARGFMNRMAAKITDLGPFDPHTYGLHRLPVTFEEA